MVSTIESNGSDDLTISFIRHLWVSMHGPTTLDSLGTSIERIITNQQRAVDFAAQLDSGARDYIALLEPLQSTRWEGFSSKARKALSIITNELGVEQIRPLMLSVVRRFEDKEIEKCFSMFLSWSVRFLIVGGGGGGKLDRYYGWTAKQVHDGTIKTAEALYSNMENIVPRDAQFREEFGRASVKRTNLARYYLRAINTYLDGDAEPALLINEDPNAVNLEHILPIKPGAEWHIDSDLAGAAHKRIGNMTLLPSKLNVALGQSAFSEKREAYANVQIGITKSIAEYHHWGLSEISKRQATLADIAPKVWPVRWK